jgi:hypothetical protein
MQTSPSKKIIEKIKREKIVPVSKLFLNWKSYSFWAIWIFTLLLGAMFFSFIILNLLDIHPMVFSRLGLGKVFFIFARTAPYLWIFLAVLATVSGFLAIRKTKRGYRYSIISITSVGVLLIAMLGGCLHIAKINKHLGDRIFIERGLPREMAFPEERRWRSPAEGMLGGEIITIETSDLNLRGFDNETWRVHYSNDTELHIEKMESGMIIEVIGERMDGGQFRAFLIRPFPFEMRMPRR